MGGGGGGEEEEEEEEEERAVRAGSARSRTGRRAIAGTVN